MYTNKAQLEHLKEEIGKIGQLIEDQGREPELKELAGKVRSGNVSVDSVIPEVMDLDPQREERLCEYYIALFSEFERLKQEELSTRKCGRDAHHEWLNSIYQQNTQTVSSTKTIARRVAEKIAISGITAGLIWLGKTILENWPFGYSYSEQAEETNGRTDE
jgi:hypothetical protein